MGLADVCDALAVAISALAPSVAPSLPFRLMAIEAPGGIDEGAFLVARSFEVAPVEAAYEGPTISLPAIGYLSHDLAVRVCYARAAFRSERDRADAMASDVGQIITAVRTPGNWSTVAQYVTTDGRPARADVLGPDGDAIGAILELRLMARWSV